MVLIPKRTKYIRDIILLETLRKVVEVLIDTGLHDSLQVHDVLHEF